MTPTQANTYVLYRRSFDTTAGITVLPVDDFSGHDDETFLMQEERGSSRFQCKPRTIMQNGSSLQFNGTRISKLHGGILVVDQGEKLRSVTKTQTKEELVSTRLKCSTSGVAQG